MSMTAGRRIITSSCDWCTPPKYITAIQNVFCDGVSLDPCSNPHSLVNAETNYMLPEKDGLVEPWSGFRNIFVNPPYGRDKKTGKSIYHWLERCAATKNSNIMALIPVATNTRHWKYFVFGCADSICFLSDTRLKFYLNGVEYIRGAPMACAMVYWGKEYLERFNAEFSRYGNIVMHCFVDKVEDRNHVPAQS